MDLLIGLNDPDVTIPQRRSGPTTVVAGVTPSLLTLLSSFPALFQDPCSRSPSICSLKMGEQLIVELKKNDGSLGISVAVSY
jgi:hypothetical protein